MKVRALLFSILFILGNQKEVGNIDQNNNYNFGAMKEQVSNQINFNVQPERIEIEGKLDPITLRSRLPTVWDIYNFLATEEKLYLPFWKKKRPRYITERYLLDILTKAAFSIQNQIKEPEEVTKPVSKGEKESW